MSRSAIAVLVVVILGLAALAGWQTVKRIQEIRDADKTGASAQALQVGVETTATATLTETVSVTGDIEALSAVDVVPKTGGTLDRLKFDDGTKVEEGVSVKAGQVIAIIEHNALDAAVEVAQAALARAEVQAREEVVVATVADAHAAVAAANASLAEAGAAVRQTQRDRERMMKLCAQGSCTEQMRDQAVTAHASAVEREKALAAQLDRAKAAESLAVSQTKALADVAVRQAEAALRMAKVQLGDATIKAPFDGVVTRRYVEEGNMVGPATPIARIADIATVKVVGNIGERHLAALTPGKTTVSLSVDAYPGAEFTGVIYLAGIEVDRATRTLKVDVRVPNADRRLRPGMFARIDVVVGRRESVVAVPDSAFIREGDRVYGYIVHNGKAHRRELKLGMSQGPLHEVLQGLLVGDSLIVRGHRLVKEGDAVRVESLDKVPAPAPSPARAEALP